MAPAFFPSIPPVIHAPAADVQFAAALSHVLYTTEPDETVYDCFMNEPINNTKCLSPHELLAGLPLSRIAATDSFDFDLQTFDNNPLPDDGGGLLNISATTSELATTNELAIAALLPALSVDDEDIAITYELATTNEVAIAPWIRPGLNASLPAASRIEPKNRNLRQDVFGPKPYLSLAPL